jgi:hypothetical protein
VEAEVWASDADIAGELTEPAAAKAGPEDEAQGCENEADEEEEFTDFGHGRSIPQRPGGTEKETAARNF